jgi:hypothetical protein
MMRLEYCDVLLQPGSQTIALMLADFYIERWITVAQSDGPRSAAAVQSNRERAILGRPSTRGETRAQRISYIARLRLPQKGTDHD